MTFDEFATGVPAALERAGETLREGLEALGEDMRAEISASVPVRTGALRDSIYSRVEAGAVVVGTDDPAGAALARAGRPIVKDSALRSAAAGAPERLLLPLAREVLAGGPAGGGAGGAGAGGRRG